MILNPKGTNVYKETSTLFNVSNDLKKVDDWLKEAVIGFRRDPEWRTGIFIEGDGQEYFNFPYIAGGAVTRSVLQIHRDYAPLKKHDYDVFCYHEFDERFRDYIKLKYDCLIQEGGSLLNGFIAKVTHKGFTFDVNFVTRFYGSEKEVLANFDIDICKVAYLGNGMVYFHSQEVLNALNNRCLSFNVTTCSESTMTRLNKWAFLLGDYISDYPRSIMLDKAFFDYYVEKEGLKR